MYRSELFQKHSRGRSVLEIALDVHMSNTGSFDRDPQEQKMDKVLLKQVLNTWVKSLQRSQLFDKAVRDLIEAAITEESCCEDRKVTSKPLSKLTFFDVEQGEPYPYDLYK